MNDKGFFCPALGVYVGGHMLCRTQIGLQNSQTRRLSGVMKTSY